MRRWHGSEEGQTLVVMVVVLTVLLAAVSFGLDWGYALAQRRLMVNAAEAGALGAGRLLATSVVAAGGQVVFNRSREDVYCEASRYTTSNLGAAPRSSSYGFTVQLGDNSRPIIWTTVSATACPPTTSNQVPASTRYVRVVSSVGYPSLIASVVGTSSITASGSARVRISGAPVAQGDRTWPMVRHYDEVEFTNGSNCGNPCNPDSATPMKFWSSQGSESQNPNMVYGNFKGQTDLSRNSSRQTGVPSLLTRWDQSGTTLVAPFQPKSDHSGNCTGGLWDTKGNEDDNQANKQCSIPNWFYYGFQGTQSLSTDHSTVSSGQEAPTPLGTRANCSSPPNYISAPSCANDRAGDWVETASGNLGSNISDILLDRIRTYGKRTAFSDNHVGQQPSSPLYGKALVIVVFLWDCAETYSSSAPAGQQWSLVPGQGSDCASISQQGQVPTPDRVHLFTAAPFTFYEGLVNTNQISGFWGGYFGDPDSCPTLTCDLNPLSNTAFLVPDQ